MPIKAAVKSVSPAGGLASRVIKESVINPIHVVETRVKLVCTTIHDLSQLLFQVTGAAGTVAELEK